jgi:AraC family transcriptional regulator
MDRELATTWSRPRIPVCPPGQTANAVASTDNNDRIEANSINSAASPQNSNKAVRRSDNLHSTPRFVIAQTSPDRVNSIKSLTVKIARETDVVVAELLRRSPGHGVTEALQRAESYAVCVHLSDLDDYDVWCEDKHVSSRAITEGTVHISDMRHAWRADIRGPFHVVNFYIPQAALDEIAHEQGASRLELNCSIRSAQADTVLKNLTLALLPALAKPDHTNKLFAEHASRTVMAHLAKTYGSIQFRPQDGRGRLAPWQERRAKELLSADLSGNLSLSELANACRLSSSHFSQAFRQTVGYPPHQWLLTQRVERAKQLLLNTDQSLCDIALATGFADQSHFTRVFSQRVKASPAAWRRAQGR